MNYLYHTVSNNISNTQLNSVVDNELRFGYNYSQANNHIKYPKPVLNFDLNKAKKACVTYYYVLIRI